MVNARACANQFLPYSSSGIALFGMRNVQAESCLNSEQIDTLFISVGGQEGGLGGGSFWAGGPKFTRDCHAFFVEASCPEAAASPRLDKLASTQNFGRAALACTPTGIGPQ